MNYKNNIKNMRINKLIIKYLLIKNNNNNNMYMKNVNNYWWKMKINN